MMPSQTAIRNVFRGSIRHALGPNQVVEYEDGLLFVSDKGKIAACGPYEKLKTQVPSEISVKDFRKNWMVPGFVDCHTHLPQLDCRNRNGMMLFDWLKTYIYPAEEKFADPNVAREMASRFFDELISHGITTAAIYATVHYLATHIAFEMAKDKGLRVIMGQALSDQNVPTALLRSAKQLLRETEKLIDTWHGQEERLFVAVTPRFAPSCSKELVQSCGEMASQAKTYFQTHLAETVDEVEWAKEHHRFKNYPGFYVDTGCMEGPSLFAHCIHLSDDEWRVMSQYRGCVAHCPTSNVFLKSGRMPLQKVWQHNIRCGFGSDVGAGPTFSMREIADCALKIHPKESISHEKAFYLATLGGAEALSLEGQIGNFVEGKWADFSLFENQDCRGHAKMVFVAGEVIYEA